MCNKEFQDKLIEVYDRKQVERIPVFINPILTEKCSPKLYFEAPTPKCALTENSKLGSTCTFFGCSECQLWHETWCPVLVAPAYYHWYYSEARVVEPNWKKFMFNVGLAGQVKPVGTKKIRQWEDAKEMFKKTIGTDNQPVFSEPGWTRFVQDIAEGCFMLDKPIERGQYVREMIFSVVETIRKDFAQFPSQHPEAGIAHTKNLIDNWKPNEQ